MSKFVFSICSVIVMFFATIPVMGAALDWDDDSTDQLWSTGSNWDPNIGGTPAGIDTLTFDGADSVTTAGTVTNIVDSSVTVSGLTYSLPYTPSTTTSIHHTTQINSGSILTVNGDFNAGIISGGPGTGSTTTGSVSIKGDTPGAGTFTVNAGASNIDIGYSDGAYNNGGRVFTLDLRELGTFNATTTNRFVLGHGFPDYTNLYLADDNNITADRLSLSGWGPGSNIYLGTANVFHVDTFTLAGDVPGVTSNGANNLVAFQSGLTSPTVTFRDEAGTGGGDLNITLGPYPNSPNNATMNLSGGTVDGLFNNILIGQSYNHASLGSQATGTLTFDAGSIVAANVTVGETPGVARSANAGIGTININGTGNFSATVMTLGNQTSVNGAPATGTVNINGGTLEAGTLLITNQLGTGASNGTVNLNSGTFAAGSVQKGAGAGTYNFNWNGGTIANPTGADSVFDAAAPIAFLTSATHTVNADAGRTITINSDITGAGTGALTKIGDGTLLLNGTNTYTADTLVNAGTLGGSGSLTSAVTVASGAALAPGESAGILTVDSGDLLAGSLLQIELGGTTPGIGGHDQLAVTGNLSLAGNLEVSVLPGFQIQSTDVFTIVTAGSIDGTFSNAVSKISLANGIGFFDVTYFGNSITLSNFQVPEPGSFGMLALGSLLLMRRRRRNK